MSSSRALPGDTLLTPLELDATGNLVQSSRTRPLRGHTAGRPPASEPVYDPTTVCVAPSASASGSRINAASTTLERERSKGKKRLAPVTVTEEERLRARIARQDAQDREAGRAAMAARIAARTNPRPGRTRLVQRRDPGLDDVGQREERDQPLRRESLWLTSGRPAEIDGCKPHHVCGICFGPKSHPVSYICGHSHCYVCIRVWLQQSWACPVCKTVMRMPPFRHFGEEDSMAYDYPHWVDETRVDYSWDGLRFPKPPRVRIAPDTPSP
ncbi:hypothetical protein B0H11DRAFT_2260908 [Mycena galericulata]|nr:hypothetical protein B0H11DRAFT_2260908 [Mycena galericulata]